MTRGSRSSLLKPLPLARLLSPIALLLPVLAFSLFAPQANAQSAASWNKQGQAAELKEDYDTAYEDYLKAHLKSPKDMRYLARVDRMRFQAAAQHVDRGRVLRQNGDLPGALNSFARALQIDPSDEAARQEIEATERLEKIPGGIPVSPAGTASSSELVNELAKIAPPAELKPISNELVSLNIASEDTKTIYQSIAKVAGINVLFDDPIQSKRIQVVLNGVSLPEALRIVGLETNTFYKALTPDTIFVTDNSIEKHNNLDDVAVQTFYLTNAVTSAEINEVANGIRQLLPNDKVFVSTSQDAIVARASTSHLAVIQTIINNLDRVKAEVVVDVAILEVNRDKIRNLGMTLPQSFTITPQPTPNATNTVGTATSTAAALASSFTLNTLGNINATNFGVTIGGATLNALMNDTDTRVLQNPDVRSTDGQEATLKVGTRVPIATGTLSGAVGGGIAGGLASSTQFNYQDVGVNITLTPQIHNDRQISLKLDILDTTDAGQVTVAGVTQPIFGQREIKGNIQLRDGEPCLIAGLLQKTDNNTTSGTPGLASIPWLKYFFSSVNKETDQDEIVFVLVPHVVRESPLTLLNTRAIDTGTQNDIQIRKMDSPAPDALLPAKPEAAVGPASNITAAQGAAAMVPQLAQQAIHTPGTDSGAATAAQNYQQNVASAAGPTPARPTTAVPPQPLTFSVTPSASTQTVNSEFNVAIAVSNASDLFSVPLQLQFDPKILQLVNVDTGSLLSSDGQPVALVHRDEGNGLVTVSASRPPGVAGVTAASGQVCVLHFRAIAAGDSNLALIKVAPRNSTGAGLPATGSQAVVHVR